ncbi:NUDIX domain-containing protein [Deinococcus lacus]|uniref:NUDIX domain-containing protein n=1 Tax=Deinococcus lacus TaxID=392561 RepID=A0ABW1YFB2_9DEIO
MTETFAIPCVGAIILRTVAGLPCVLLQTRCKPGAGLENGLLELPAGKMREYEDLLATLRREVTEETGLTITVVSGERWAGESLGYRVCTAEPYCVTQNLSGGYSILLLTFLCEVSGTAHASAESHGPHWLPLAQLAWRLEHSPQAFYPLHLGALRRLAAEWAATPLVFVYGTLQPGRRNAAWASAVAAPLEAQPATLEGFALYHLGAYPGIQAAAGAG